MISLKTSLLGFLKLLKSLVSAMFVETAAADYSTDYRTGDGKQQLPLGSSCVL